MDIEAGKRRIVTVSREGLIAMKRIAGRPKDLLDIATLRMSNRREHEQAQDVDMSPEAVARRLDTVQSLYELMVDLRGARVIGKVRDRHTRER